VFVLELKSVDLMKNELAWTSLLKQVIDEKCYVAEHILQLRIIKIQENFTNNRMDEIEQHKNLFSGHMKVSSENVNPHIYFTIILIQKKKIINRIREGHMSMT